MRRTNRDEKPLAQSPARGAAVEGTLKRRRMSATQPDAQRAVLKQEAPVDSPPCAVPSTPARGGAPSEAMHEVVDLARDSPTSSKGPGNPRRTRVYTLGNAIEDITKLKVRPSAMLTRSCETLQWQSIRNVQESIPSSELSTCEYDTVPADHQRSIRAVRAHISFW